MFLLIIFISEYIYNMSTFLIFIYVYMINNNNHLDDDYADDELAQIYDE